MSFLQNKRALICGLANDRSIAAGIAKAMHKQGAELAFTYQNDKLKPRVEKFAQSVNSDIVLPCDVAEDQQIHDLFHQLQNHWDGFDILVHSIAFAPSDQLAGDYVDCVNREGFRIAHEVSSYSLAALAQQAYPMMAGRDGSIMAMTYIGANRAVANYNVMGIAKASLEANVRYLAQSLGPKGLRVNAISAGPVKTLASSGIGNLRSMLDYNASISPLRKNISTEEIGNTAAFLNSDLASGITGEIIHVDAGFHMVGMEIPDHQKSQ
jgi:enoyl-[acyl-carrier protein] reductase I